MHVRPPLASRVARMITEQLPNRRVTAHRGGTLLKEPYVRVELTDFTGDYLDTLSPSDARQMAALLIEAADRAEGGAS